MKYLSLLAVSVCIAGAADSVHGQNYYWPSPSNAAQSTGTYGCNYNFQTRYYPTYAPSISTYFYNPQPVQYLPPAKNCVNSISNVAPQSPSIHTARTSPLLWRGCYIDNSPVLIYNGSDRSSRISELQKRISALQHKIDQRTTSSVDERLNLHEKRLAKQTRILQLIEQNIAELSKRRQSGKASGH